MARNIAGILLAVFASCTFAYAEKFPIIGETYQLDSAKYPGKVAICSTEEAMTKYMEAQWAADKATTQKMLVKIKTMDDVKRMKQSKKCTLISSYSQAEIIEKGVESHRANFMAFPLEPMWGYYLYFGGRVR